MCLTQTVKKNQQKNNIFNINLQEIRINMKLIKKAEKLLHKVSWIIDKSITSVYQEIIEN